MPKQTTSTGSSIKARLSQIRFNLWKRNHAQHGKQQELNHETKETFRMKLAKSLSKAKGIFKLSRPKLRLAWFNPRAIFNRKWRLPQQIVRWDLVGVTMSYLWGKANGQPLPRWARSPLYKAWGYAFKANMQEAKQPLHEYRCLKEFFTRTLKDGSRPVAPTGMASPVDAKIIVLGEVTGDRVEHVKGITYTASGFLGSDISTVKKNPNNKLYHCVLYLAPGDYHRIHSPIDWSVMLRRHFPGTLFPVAPTVTRLIPNLLALNERVVLNGEWEQGFFSLAAVGAYNVGSIVINFDPDVKTNAITRDFRCPNLRYFSYGGIGTHAYEKVYEPIVEQKRGDELGLFNLGSTIVLFFECSSFDWKVSAGDKVRMGQHLGTFGPVFPLPDPSAIPAAPSISPASPGPNLSLSASSPGVGGKLSTSQTSPPDTEEKRRKGRRNEFI